jgi:LysM repeat protein
MSDEYSTTTASVENMHMEFLMNRDNVKSDIMTDLNNAKQHELEEVSPTNYSAQSPRRTEEVTRYDPAPEEPFDDNQLQSLYDNPKITALMREYELLPPRHQKGRRMGVLLALQRYEGLGYKLSQRYTIDSDYYEMLHEREAILYMKNKENSITIFQNFFLTFIQTLEYMNEKYNPFGLRLKGIHETTYAHIDDYHEIIGELIDKYSAAGSHTEPEVRLALLFVGAVITTHGVQSNVENTIAKGTFVEKMAKNTTYNQYKQVFGLNSKKLPPRQPQRYPQRPTSRPPSIPVGGYAPGEIKEYKNDDIQENKASEHDLEENLKAELEKTASLTSLNSQGKPKKKKSGRALQM